MNKGSDEVGAVCIARGGKDARAQSSAAAISLTSERYDGDDLHS
jgi:hypothetical protein